MSQEIIAACVNKESARELNFDAKYFVGNKELAAEVLFVLDSIKYRIQRELKVNLMSEEMNGLSLPPEDEIDESPPEKESRGFLYNTMIALLSCATAQKYEGVRATAAKELEIEKKEIPSYYMLTKNRPKIESISIAPSNAHLTLC